MRQLTRWLGGVACRGLAGCATPLVVWDKPGATVQDFRTDQYECIQQSRTSWSGGGSGALGLGMLLHAQLEAKKEANALFKLCMEARGYTAHEKHDGDTAQVHVSPPAERQPVRDVVPLESSPPLPPVAPIVQSPMAVVPVSAPPPAPVPEPASVPVAAPLVAVSQQPVVVVPTAAVPPAPTEGEPRVLQFSLQYAPAPLLRTPDMDAGKVGKVDSGAAVRVLEDNDNWLLVQTRTGVRGWVAKVWLRH